MRLVVNVRIKLSFRDVLNDRNIRNFVNVVYDWNAENVRMLVNILNVLNDRNIRHIQNG